MNLLQTETELAQKHSSENKLSIKNNIKGNFKDRHESQIMWVCYAVSTILLYYY